MLFGKYNGQHTKQKKKGREVQERQRTCQGANDLGRHREGKGRHNVHCLQFCFHYRNIENEIERNAWRTHLYASRAAMMTTSTTGALLLGIKKYYAKRSRASGLAKGGYTNTQ